MTMHSGRALASLCAASIFLFVGGLSATADDDHAHSNALAQQMKGVLQQLSEASKAHDTARMTDLNREYVRLMSARNKWMQIENDTIKQNAANEVAKKQQQQRLQKLHDDADKINRQHQLDTNKKTPRPGNGPHSQHTGPTSSGKPGQPNTGN